MKSFYVIALDTLTGTYFVKTKAGEVIGANFKTRTEAKRFIQQHEKEGE